jgi:DNA (cytosine-5)-methyltransferase 1
MAPELGMPDVDWQFTAEIEPFPCSVIRAHGDLPNLGDVTADDFIERAKAYLPIDLIVFGSPCQDLSVAGNRAGMAGARSGLFYVAIRIVRELGCRFALWENVPGAFSSNSGADFASVVGEMVGVQFDVPRGGWRNTGVAIGPDGLVEWVTLDAQWFGVPQRRRRIFALRDSGNWTDRPPILFDADSLQGNSPPRRETREGITGTISSRAKGGGGLGTDFDIGGGLRVEIFKGPAESESSGRLGHLRSGDLPLSERGANADR